jgi:hypothetical protein
MCFWLPNKMMKNIVGSLDESNAVESGDNLFRLDDLGGAIPRRLSPIRWAAQGGVGAQSLPGD